MYIYIYIYICMYICIYIYMYIYTCLHTWLWGNPRCAGPINAIPTAGLCFRVVLPPASGGLAGRHGRGTSVAVGVLRGLLPGTRSIPSETLDGYCSLLFGYTWHLCCAFTTCLEGIHDFEWHKKLKDQQGVVLREYSHLPRVRPTLQRAVGWSHVGFLINHMFDHVWEVVWFLTSSHPPFVVGVPLALKLSRPHSIFRKHGLRLIAVFGRVLRVMHYFRGGILFFSPWALRSGGLENSNPKIFQTGLPVTCHCGYLIAHV